MDILLQSASDGRLMRLEAVRVAVGKRSERKYEISFSVGQATRGHDKETLDVMIDRADELMYQTQATEGLSERATA